MLSANENKSEVVYTRQKSFNKNKQINKENISYRGGAQSCRVQSKSVPT